VSRSATPAASHPAHPDAAHPAEPYRHLPEMVRRAAEAYRDAIAFTQVMPNGMNGTLRYRDVDRHSDHFAAYLREVLGLQPGDRVAVQMPNCLAYPVVAFGVMKAGCVLVNTNPLYTAPEMVHQFTDAGAKVLVIVDIFADRLPESIPRTPVETVVTVRITEFFPALVAKIIRGVQRYWNRQLPPVEVPHTPFDEALAAGRERVEGGAAVASYLEGVGRDTVAVLQYTGGTTGVSKGAMLTHGNLLANTDQVLDVGADYLEPRKETVLTALPLYHIFAFTANLLVFFRAGGHNVLVPSPRPPSNLKRAFENYPITWLTGVNTLFHALLNEPWFTDYPPRHLKAAISGGMSLHESVGRRWQEVTGTPVAEGYGLTETSPVLTVNPLDRLKPGSIGKPVAGTEIRCLDDAGKAVPRGTPGELAARGPQVMPGYWNRPDETARAMDDEGWFRTGDVAEEDEEGYFRIVDRKKDMILVSGFNVYPNEVEEVIAAHPKVREAAVIGVPDESSGEAVKAYVAAADPALTAEEVVKHCRASLAAYKVPRQVEFRDELPKSPIGKILRRELRPDASGSAAGGSGAIPTTEA
jgi:long-chain acyl-CoA synthetase